MKHKETRASEMREAKKVRSGKMSPTEYAKMEKAEGHRTSMGKLESTGRKLASGKLSPSKYAKGR